MKSSKFLSEGTEESFQKAFQYRYRRAEGRLGRARREDSEEENDSEVGSDGQEYEGSDDESDDSKLEYVLVI